MSSKKKFCKILRTKSTSEMPNDSDCISSSPGLGSIEKLFLLSAERGDCASVQRIIEENKGITDFNINCLDPLNRSALIIAIEKENIDMINILLDACIQVKDSLLHAINEEYVEGVEALMNWEERNHIPGRLHSWESVNKSSSAFSLDITPLILAAHKNNYEILKLLIDKGATLPSIHDIQCNCKECVSSREDDSLRHVQARLNIYRARISPSLICLTSKDPILTVIELFNNLKKLERLETEFRVEYHNMRCTVQTFATDLLDQIRTSEELQIILNYDSKKEPPRPGDRQTLDRLKLAMKYKLKLFVVHPNVQHLLESLWYDGLDDFEHRNIFYRTIFTLKIGLGFVFYSIAYILFPSSSSGKLFKQAFIQFICNSTSYLFFLFILVLSSQRVERLTYVLLGITTYKEFDINERGSLPGILDRIVIIYFVGILFKEVRKLYYQNLIEYASNLWNILNFITNSFFVTWIALRFTAVYVVLGELEAGYKVSYTREEWDNIDPHMVSDMCFTAAMILSFMKLVNIFSINRHLGTLQICLGRMIIDVIKFFSLYVLVLLAFGCGLNQLLWYFAAIEMEKCYHNHDNIPDYEKEDKACTIWRRFANLFETVQSLYWSSFGLVDLTVFDLTGLKSVPRFWCLLLFGCYCTVNIILLLNMLIAMLSSSYQIIFERADNEWKFARSKLFVNFFEKEDILPPPFNLIPTCRSIKNLFQSKIVQIYDLHKKERYRQEENFKHSVVMNLLVKRYIMSEQKKLEKFGVTEDDIAEVRHDVSKLRFELRNIFKENNFVIPKGQDSEYAQGKKERFLERRIIKNFQIGTVQNVVDEIVSTKKIKENVFKKLANKIEEKIWASMDRDSVRTNISDDSDEPVTTNKHFRQKSDLDDYILECSANSSGMKLDPTKMLVYEPDLVKLTPAARIAFAKFKSNFLLKKKGTRHQNIKRKLGNWKTGSRNSDLQTISSMVSGTGSIESKTEIIPSKFFDEVLLKISDSKGIDETTSSSFPEEQSPSFDAYPHVDDERKLIDNSTVINIEQPPSADYLKESPKRGGIWL